MLDWSSSCVLGCWYCGKTVFWWPLTPNCVACNAWFRWTSVGQDTSMSSTSWVYAMLSLTLATGATFAVGKSVVSALTVLVPWPRCWANSCRCVFICFLQFTHVLNVFWQYGHINGRSCRHKHTSDWTKQPSRALFWLAKIEMISVIFFEHAGLHNTYFFQQWPTSTSTIFQEISTLMLKS